MSEHNKKMLKHNGYSDVMDLLQSSPKPKSGWCELIRVIIWLSIITTAVIWI